MNARILVTYATRAGSTVEVAAAIAETLTARGFTVDVRPVKEKPALAGYQAVVMGSAIRMGSWLPESVDFVKNHQVELQKIPTALFTVHMLNTDDSPASQQARQAYTAPLRAMLDPAAEVFFTGMLDPKRLSLGDRLLTRMVQKSTQTPLGDFRDWEKIRNWAGSLPLNGRPCARV